MRALGQQPDGEMDLLCELPTQTCFGSNSTTGDECSRNVLEENHDITLASKAGTESMRRMLSKWHTVPDGTSRAVTTKVMAGGETISLEFLRKRKKMYKHNQVKDENEE